MDKLGTGLWLQHGTALIRPPAWQAKLQIEMDWRKPAQLNRRMISVPQVVRKMCPNATVPE